MARLKTTLLFSEYVNLAQNAAMKNVIAKSFLYSVSITTRILPGVGARKRDNFPRTSISLDRNYKVSWLTGQARLTFDWSHSD